MLNSFVFPWMTPNQKSRETVTHTSRGPCR